MTVDVRQLLRQGTPAPAREIDFPALVNTAKRRRRHRRALISAALAAVVAIASGSAIVVLGDGASDTRVAIATTPTATNEAAGLSMDLPAGWKDLPRADTAAPTERLVVGTTSRPESDPIQACHPDNGAPLGSAYVTVYEYLPGDDLNNPSHDGIYAPEAFQPRPADFATATQSSGDCAAPTSGAPPSETGAPATTVAGFAPAAGPPDSTTAPESTAPQSTAPGSTEPPTTEPPATDNHFREIPFVDADRMFVARVVSTGDPSRKLLDEGIGVLNTLRVQQAETPTTTATTTVPDVSTTRPPAGPGPSDEAAARQAIQDAMTAAYGGASPVPIDESVEGGHPFTASERATAATAPGAEPAVEGKIVVRINWLVFVSPTRATVNFDLLVDGAPITATTTGYAVFEGGRWRMGRETFCEITARGGVITCPR